MVVNDNQDITAVPIATKGNPIAILFIVLKVDPNYPTDSYTGTEFSLILGKCIWSLPKVTFESWTKFVKLLITPDLTHKIICTEGRRRYCTKKRICALYYECNKNL